MLPNKAILASQVTAFAQNEVTQTDAGTRMHRLDLRKDPIVLMLACRNDPASLELIEIGFFAKPFLEVVISLLREKNGPQPK